jgi:hypothetical protein
MVIHTPVAQLSAGRKGEKKTAAVSGSKEKGFVCDWWMNV